MGLPAARSADVDVLHIQLARHQLEPCLGNLRWFLRRYAPKFYRIEQARHARTYIEGLLSDLPRKTIEPIASDHGQHRRALQRFVGAGLWHDQEVLAELSLHVREELGDPQGILVLDGCSFPKKGKESVGVKRQWCGRLGKRENCQVGVYLAYVGSGGAALVRPQLYLPRDWCRSPKRRAKCHVPEEIRFRTRVEIAGDLLKEATSFFPHAWVTGDDEFGRPAWFRKLLTRRKEHYVLEVPATTLIRNLEPAVANCQLSQKGEPKRPFVQATIWAHQQPARKWTLVAHNGEKGPLKVEAIRTAVRARDELKVGPIETLLVTRTLEARPEYRFHLSNADASVKVEELVRVSAARHRIEECFQLAKGEAGMAHYEVRSWVGWHHHMTLSLLSAWFLTLEQRRVGEKNTGSLGPAHGHRVSGAIADPRQKSRLALTAPNRSAPSEREGSDPSLAQPWS